METIQDQVKQKAGFTLTEVMVALSVFVMLSAGILKSYLFFGRTVQRRVEFNQNLSRARYFSEFFEKQIDASQRSMLALDPDGNRLFFTVRNASNSWEVAMLQYRPDENDLVFTRNQGSKVMLPETAPEGSGGAFSISNGVAQCRLRVGNENPSVALNTAARPRNP